MSSSPIGLLQKTINAVGTELSRDARPALTLDAAVLQAWRRLVEATRSSKLIGRSESRQAIASFTPVGQLVEDHRRLEADWCKLS